jgi:hypothetical protein
MVSINLCDINGNSSKVLGRTQNSIHGANGVWIGNKHKLWNYKLLSMERKFEKQGDHINPLMIFPRFYRTIVL